MSKQSTESESDPEYAYDNIAPIETGYVTDFGIVFPSNTGFDIRKATGGVCCHQLRFSGVYLPMGHPKMNRGWPEWFPETEGGIPKGEKHPVTDVDLTTIPDRDFESLPEWVQERGQFHNWDEFSYWMDEHAWWYGWTDLVEELRLWNYDPTGELRTARELTRVWDGLEDIWAAINDCLSFTYEVYDYHEEKMEALRNDEEFTAPLGNEYPGPCEGIRWITITGSKRNRDGEIRTPWAEELKGETVMLVYPNCD